MAETASTSHSHQVHYSVRGDTRQSSRTLQLDEPAAEPDVLRTVAEMLVDLIRRDRWLLIDGGRLLRASEVVGLHVTSVAHGAPDQPVTGFALALEQLPR